MRPDVNYLKTVEDLIARVEREIGRDVEIRGTSVRDIVLVTIANLYMFFKED